jgi:hypothetical protein
MRSKSLVVACAVLALATLPHPHSSHAQSVVGAVYVATEPAEAAVYVNGELRGVSPCGIPDVGVGQVEVRVEKQGYERTVQAVQVEADKTAILDFVLTRLPNVGSLAVQVEPPGSQVALDRVGAGQTPLTVLNLRAGTYGVVVSRRGYRPFYATVTVAAGQHFVLKGTLEAEGAQAAAGEGATGPGPLGVLDPDKVPASAEQAENRAFDGVRRLLAERDYEQAVQLLDRMAGDPALRGYAARIGRDYRLVRRMQEVVTQAVKQMRQSEGQDYVLALRKGIRLTGRLVKVTDTHAVVVVAGEEREIALASVAAEQIVRLASHGMDPRSAANQLNFALLHAAEGEFAQSYEHLGQAAGAGYDITAARSYVDAEHLWAAAVQREATERLQARVFGQPAPQKLDVGAAPVPLIVDAYHGVMPPPELQALLKDAGLESRQLDGPFGLGEGEQLGVMLLIDPGPGRAGPAYDRREVQAVVDFVRRGGGLLCFGAPRPKPLRGPQAPHPFLPLLQWFGAAVRADQLSVSRDAPKDYPRDYAIGLPVSRSPLVYGVGAVAFPIASPSVAAQAPAWVLLRADRFVGSDQAADAGPALAAVRELGTGRIAVVAALPSLGKSPWPGSPLSGNTADVFLRNLLLWLAEPARRQSAAEGA